jgi:hypothetical protein
VPPPNGCGPRSTCAETASRTPAGDGRARAREDADRVAATLRSDGEELHQRLLGTAAHIERAMDDAAAEQRRREAENDRRREEHRRAQFAERERREQAARQRAAGGSRRAGSPR